MNTNPLAKRILCFGDSNTCGVVPQNLQEKHSSRWPADIRWTGVAQDLLGKDFDIIESGMSGRTSGFDWIWKADKSNRNGREHLFVSLRTHRPVDLVIVCLGVNELRNNMTASGVDVYLAIKELQKMVQVYVPRAHFLCVVPPRPISRVLNQTEPGVWDDSDRKFNEFVESVREDHEMNSMDLSQEVNFDSEDGLHMNTDNHKTFGELVAQKVKEILA